MLLIILFVLSSIYALFSIVAGVWTTVEADRLRSTGMGLDTARAAWNEQMRTTDPQVDGTHPVYQEFISSALDRRDQDPGNIRVNGGLTALHGVVGLCGVLLMFARRRWGFALYAAASVIEIAQYTIFSGFHGLAATLGTITIYGLVITFTTLYAFHFNYLR